MMRRFVTTLSVLVMVLALTAPAFAQTVLFGPKTYTHTAGPPNQFTDQFTLPSGATAPYTLHIVNGNATATNRISSATVTLNGGSAARQVPVTLPLPIITGFTPASGRVGDTVTITGIIFINVQTVTFNGVAAGTFTVLNPTSIAAVVPTSATTGKIAVTDVAGTATSAADFLVLPTVASLQPATLSIVRGTTGTLTVTLSAAQTTATSVTLASSNPAVATVPGTVTVPANQLSAPVTVTAVAVGQTDITASLNGTSATSTISIINPVPSITILAPVSLPSGSPNTTLTVTGQSFVTGATVHFGATALVTTFVSTTQLTATIPAAQLTAKGTVSVTVANPAPGGGASNSLPFTIVNGAPVLAPIGNKTIPLGSTLTFTATATDPDNDPVTFAMTPLPLPAHATFNSQSGVFTFTPDAAQVGSISLTILASDGILTVSETITITVTGAAPGGVTGVSGRVVDGSGQPIANLPLSVKGTTATTTTNALGQFTLNNLTVSGKQVLLANGFALGYAILAAPVDLIPNVMNNLASELRVPVIDMASAITVNPNATTMLGNPNLPGVSVTIPPHTAKNPDGTDYAGVLTISPVPEYGRPESRPVELRPGFSITIQPAGITFTTPAPITLPNTDNLPPGNELDLWSLSPDTGTFYVAGRMRVSPDGSRLETISGGVQKTAWHFAMAPALALPNEQNKIIGGCTECDVSSRGDLTEGTLTQDVTIPGVRTVGQSRDLTLHYTSTTADVRPILPITATLDVSAAVPQTFSAEMTVGGLQQGPRGYWNASAMNEAATSTTRLGVQYDASPLPTGRYPYELATFSNYAQSSIGAISRGFTMIRNEQQSAFGAGWTLRGVDRLIQTTSNTLLRAGGDGRTIPFVNTSVANFVSWWSAEGSAQDLSSGQHGTLQNGATFASGQVGQAFSFDGIDDYVTIPDSAVLDNLGSAASLELWVKPILNPAAPQPTFRWLFARRNPNLKESFSVGLTETGRLVVVVQGTGLPSSSFWSASGAVTSDVWQHVAVSVDLAAASLHAYVNGQEVSVVVINGPGTLGGAFVNVTEGYLGRWQSPDVQASGVGPAYFKGQIDEVELYARVLSASELNAHFTAGGRKDLTAEFLAPPSEYSTLKRNLDGTYIRTLKDGTTYQFNIQGLQTSMADRNGNTTTYAYNGSNQLTTITDPAGQITTLSYSGSRLATLTDPAGRATQFQHDSAGNLIRVTDPASLVTAFAYDAQHRLTQRTDAQNQIYAYQFDYAGRLQRATLPGGAFREIRPTELTAVPNLAAGQGTPANPATITQPPIIQATFKDAKGQTTTFETDAIGRVTKQIDPLNRTTTIARDPQGNPLVITRPNGAVTTMTYDAKGNLLTSTEQSIAATTSFTYEPAFNQVTRITDPKGNQTNITYDAKGNPLTITDADNNVTTFTYDSRGLLLTSKDALNQTTTFTYDAQGRLLTTTDPLNRTTTLTYDNAGNVATSTDALNRITTFQYDQKNRLKQVTDPLTGVTQYTYDGNGNLLTVKDAKNQVTSFAYDDRNRLISTTDPLGKVEAYTYDGNDNLTKRRTPKGDDILFAYNAVNELLSKTLLGNLITSYQYDLVGNLTTVTDPDSVLTMTYDVANRLTGVSTAGSSHQPGVTLNYAYDKVGNRVSLTDSTGTNGYTYDALNRLITLASPHAGACPIPFSTGLVSWWQAEGTAADAQGTNPGTLINGAGFTAGQVGQAFQFNGFDQYVQVAASPSLTMTAALTVTAWAYPTGVGNSGTLANMLVNKEGEYELARFPDGTLQYAVANTTPGWTFVNTEALLPLHRWTHVAVTYDGSVIQTYVNGARVHTQSGAGSIGDAVPALNDLRIGARSQVVGTLQSWEGLIDDVRLYHRALDAGEVTTVSCQDTTSFTYDALNRRTSVTRPNGTSTTFTYDPASQVTHILHQIVASSTQINQAEYAYNPVGNRTSLTDKRGSQAFGYDSLDRLTSASHPLLTTPQAFAYDPVGNRTTGGSVVNAGNQLTADTNYAYQYDDNGNLTRKMLLATGNFTTYAYDAENRLTKVEDFVAGNPIPAATSTYRYDGLGRRVEKVANGQTKRYIYDGEDILLEYDGANVLQARYTHGPGIDEPIAVTKGSSTFFYHQDGLGTVTDLTDSAGVTAKSYSYDAYGNILESPGTLEQPYTYTGREFDSETGLSYYRARYYSPTLGRFISEDPIGFAGGDWNLYAYVKNRPTTYKDPTGLRGESCETEVPGDSLGGRKDQGGGEEDQPFLMAAAQGPGKLNRCLDACAAGGAAWNRFCRGLPDPRLRAGCWALQFGGETACRGWCFWNFSQ